MRKTMLLAVGAVAALSAIGCTRPYYRYHAGVLTPATPEGMACRRQCLALVGTCSNYLRGDHTVVVEVGRWTRAYGCPGMVSDCLELCPGAVVDPEHPPRMIPVGFGDDGDDGDDEGAEFAD